MLERRPRNIYVHPLRLRSRLASAILARVKATAAMRPKAMEATLAAERSWGGNMSSPKMEVGIWRESEGRAGRAGEGGEGVMSDRKGEVRREGHELAKIVGGSKWWPKTLV